MSDGRPSTVNMALFIDVENLISAASALGLPIDLGPVIESLKGQGRILVRRCYGDIRKCLEHVGRRQHEDSIRRMLTRNLVQIEDIPYTTSHKNTADMRIVVDALSEAFTNNAISHFVILSSDRDYVPLCNKLHELNKTVISIVVDRMNVNPMVLEAADRVEYYESFLPTPAAGKAPTASGEADMRGEDTLAASQMNALCDEYFRVLQQAIRALEAENRKCVASEIVPKMSQIRSDFAPANIGLKNFKEFTELAERKKIVKVDWAHQNGVFVLAIGEKSADPVPTALLPTRQNLNEQQRIQKLVGDYWRYLDDKLKIRMPDYETRKRILKVALDTYQELQQGEGQFYLSQWKDEIMKSRKGEYQERIIYKVLLSLLHARCFYHEEGMERWNPVIVGIAIDPNRWEEVLITNLCRQLNFESSFRPLSSAALAECFYPKLPDRMQRIEAILVDIK